MSDRALLLQGIYSASKHAVKGFTDALRMELDVDGAPVSVTLIKPAAIDTPYARNAKNHMEKETQVPPPVYAPRIVANAILHCAEHPERDVFVGAGAKNLSALGYHAASLMDRVMETALVGPQKKDSPPRPREENGLDRPSGQLEERGGYSGHVAKTSLYTRASLHPVMTGAALVGTGVAAAVLWRTTHNGDSNGGTRKRNRSRAR